MLTKNSKISNFNEARSIPKLFHLMRLFHWVLRQGVEKTRLIGWNEYKKPNYKECHKHYDKFVFPRFYPLTEKKMTDEWKRKSLFLFDISRKHKLPRATQSKFLTFVGRFKLQLLLLRRTREFYPWHNESGFISTHTYLLWESNKNLEGDKILSFPQGENSPLLAPYVYALGE